MKKYIHTLKRSRLFSGIREEEIGGMLSCLGARVQNYTRGQYVFRQGDAVSCISLLVEGELHVQADDYWGNRTILSHVTVGEMFAEAYISPDGGAIQNDVVATEDSTVMFFDVTRIFTTCSSACSFHTAVVRNLFFGISEKNRRLVEKLGHMSKRSTREKLLSYLSEQAKRQKSGEFEIPFNRQQLADFLCVDRSAMSNELCKLRDEGLLEFEKNRFKLI